MTSLPSECHSRLLAWRARADEYAYRLKIHITAHVADSAVRQRIFNKLSALLEALQDFVRVHGNMPQNAQQALKDTTVSTPLKLTVLQLFKNLLAALPVRLQKYITKQDLLLSLLNLY